MRRLFQIAAVSAAMAGAVQLHAQSITTTFAHDNGFAGNMFNVTIAASSLTFTSMDVNAGTFLGATGAGSGFAGQFELWTRTGSYVGFESNAAGWTSRGIVTATTAGTNLATVVNFADFTLSSGTHGFFVNFVNWDDFTEGDLLYTNGSNTYSNADLTLTTGIGKGNGGFSGSNFANRTWNGTLRYTAPSTVVPEPATVTLIAVGLAGLVAVQRRRRS